MPEPDRREIETELRRRAHRWGLSAETRAAWFLRLKGYRILAHRFKVVGGEIDLVARKRGVLVFVEVKARTEERDALEAVDAKTRRRLQVAANRWGQRFPYYQSFIWRYDIIAILPGRLPLHIVGAFRAGN